MGDVRQTFANIIEKKPGSGYVDTAENLGNFIGNKKIWEMHQLQT